MYTLKLIKTIPEIRQGAPCQNALDGAGACYSSGLSPVPRRRRAGCRSSANPWDVLLTNVRINP